jgi:Fe-S-cluster-containing dehydrogenase component
MERITRRELLKKGSVVGAGLAIGSSVGKKASAAEKGEKTPLPKIVERSRESNLERMEKDLQRALQKPLHERHWVYVIDVKKCVGCAACIAACQTENRTPPGVVYRPVIHEELGRYPNVTRRHIPRLCNQCDNPPCTPVCPVDATYKRDDGIVVMDYDRCIGCRYCATACPYNSRLFDFGEFYARGKGFFPIMPYENVPTYEYKVNWKRHKGRSPVGNVRKCHFCLHRIERGLLPQCLVTCLGGVNYFGDSNDSKSLVSVLISKSNVMRLKEELGTKPQVYYLL